MSDNIQSDQIALFSIIDSMDINPPSVDTTSDTTVVAVGAPVDTATAPVDTATIPVDTTPTATTPTATADPADEPSDEVNMDEYMARFEKIQSQNEVNKQLLAAIMSSPHDQARVKALIEYVVHSQSHTEEIYNLLVDMNNLFGK